MGRAWCRRCLEVAQARAGRARLRRRGRDGGVLLPRADRRRPDQAGCGRPWDQCSLDAVLGVPRRREAAARPSSGRPPASALLLLERRHQHGHAAGRRGGGPHPPAPRRAARPPAAQPQAVGGAHQGDPHQRCGRHAGPVPRGDPRRTQRGQRLRAGRRPSVPRPRAPPPHAVRRRTRPRRRNWGAAGVQGRGGRPGDATEGHACLDRCAGCRGDGAVGESALPPASGAERGPQRWRRARLRGCDQQRPAGPACHPGSRRLHDPRLGGSR